MLVSFCFSETTPIAAQSTVGAPRIHGTVFDGETELPLQSVRIEHDLNHESTISDIVGNFSLPGLSEGVLTLTFSHIGYRPRSVTVATPLDSSLRVSLTPVVLILDEDVVVTASRTPESVLDVPALVTVLTRQTIRERNIQQTPELLREAAGVTVQKTNQGGGSPRIRGFRANKLLFLIDGIRMNNATYRGGNFQYLNTIDTQSIERMEIVHGPNSVMYGSDALGGVINAITVEPDMGNRDGIHKSIGFTSQLSTADRTRTGNLSMDLSSLRWGARISGGIKSYGDVTRGKNGGDELMSRLRNDSRTARILDQTQRPNAYESFDLNARFRFQLADLHLLSLAYQDNRQSKVPRYDVVETISDSSRHFDPQIRRLVFVRYINDRATRLYNNISASVSWHRQFERRIRLRFGNPNASIDQFGTNSYGVQVHFNKVVKPGHHLVYGGDIYYDDVGARSYAQSIDTGDRISTAPLFPDGSTFVTNGYFIKGEWKVAPAITITPGLRWSLSRLEAPFKSGPLNPFSFGPIAQSSSALTGSIGVVADISDRGRWVANVGQGFRTPNLDDVSKLGPGKGGTIFEVPNSGLSPEKSLSIDSGLKIDTGVWQANVIGFYNRIHDLLLRRPALLNGSPTAFDAGDTLQVFRKENGGQAFTAGFAASIGVRLHGPVTFRANMGYTYGEDTTRKEPLTAIPPLNGLVGLDWEDPRFRVSGNVRYSDEQRRLSAEDQLDLRIPEGGSPAWYTLNLRGSIALKKHVQIQWALTNILDQNYREHSSGLNAPGRNIILGISLSHD